MIYTQEQVNLHSHTIYSGHGEGYPADYVKIAAPLKVIGFSEHSPQPGNDFPPSWLSYCNLEPYTALVRHEQLQNDKRDVKVLLGLECEWKDNLKNFFVEELLGKYNFDYLISGIHFYYYPDGTKKYIGKIEDFRPCLKWYVDVYTKALSSGLFLFGCHPDLFARGIYKWDKEAESASRDIIQCAIDLDIPLEMNDYGLRKKRIMTAEGERQPYTVIQFWQMAKDMGVKICTNTDAHFLKDIHGNPTDGYKNASYAMAAGLGIKFVNWDITFHSGKKTDISAC